MRPLVPEPAHAAAAASGRLPFGATPRSIAVLLAGLILLVPAWIDRRAALAFLVWDVVVLVVWLIDLRRLPSPSQVAITRRWTAALSLRVPGGVELSVANGGAVPVRAWVTDDVHPALRTALVEVTLDVPAGESGTTTYDVEPGARGDVRMGDVYVRYRTGWGMAERWAVARVAQVVRVYPDLHAARRHAMFLVRSRQIAMEKRRARSPVIGREFESLREFRDGDDMRDVCWTATARRARMVTKVYQPERSQAVWIVVDGGRLLRARIDGRTKLDTMVDAALAIGEVAMTAGDRVALLTYGGALRQQLPPGRGPRHLRAIVEALAVHQAESTEADHAAAAAAVLIGQKQRALVVWLTDLADTAGVPDVIDGAMQLTRRHLVVFAVMGEPEMSALAAASPASDAEMYRVLAAQETTDRRAQQLHAVRQRGVLALEVPPGDLVPALVNQYLSVKERSLV